MYIKVPNDENEQEQDSDSNHRFSDEPFKPGAEHWLVVIVITCILIFLGYQGYF